jgi:hypothetical protein
LPERALDRWGGDAVGGVESKKDIPVMQMDGVVDELGMLQLSSHLQKVIWQQDKLVVWLAVPTSKLKQNRPWSDIYAIAHRFLVGVPYYKAVEVKVVADERPELVQFSVIADREHMQEAPKPGTADVQTFIRQHLSVIEQKSK